MHRQESTILCIDDDWNSLEGLKALLELQGYKVLMATSGRQGLELLGFHEVDCVILDYEMPEMYGDVVAARVKQLRSDIPIVMLSAHSKLPANRLRSVDAFLNKGQPPAELFATLRELSDARLPFFSRWFDLWKRRQAA